MGSFFSLDPEFAATAGPSTQQKSKSTSQKNLSQQQQTFNAKIDWGDSDDDWSQLDFSGVCDETADDGETTKKPGSWTD